MGKINLGKVILGGLLAGLIINIGEYLLNEIILGKQWAEALQKLNLPPMTGSVVGYFVVISFALGIVMVWVYAAIRPRFGAGPWVAVCAGLTVWALGSLYPTAFSLAMNMFPTNLLVYGLLWQFFELPIAAVVGAWPYKE